MLAAEGDNDAKEIITYTTDVLGRTLANIATIVNPEKILIGGGVSNAGDQMLNKIKRHSRSTHYVELVKSVN
ncbi:ROK family protein [Oceanobacillus halotolerans]|uniref:ROK family protein n=1 Tax=Oceanobacillus halotolerans TaxID=2663380 RepID=UPI0021F54611|nr:ROK family protein [Oceanobacillus halotolerans]